MTQRINQSWPQAVIVCALMSEAKPLIERYRIKKCADAPFDLFTGQAIDVQQNSITQAEPTAHQQQDHGAQCWVLVAGIGALNMATAIGWLGAQLNSPRQCWLNVGIAGHSHLSVGEGFVVAKSVDALGGRTFIPPQVAKRPAALSDIISVNVPSGDYPDNGGLDMECYAFFQAATKFAQSECVQSYKVVSDNPSNALENLNADKIYQLVSDNLAQIDAFIGALTGLLDQLPTRARGFEVPHHRASHSQQRQVNELVTTLSNLLSKNLIEQVTLAASQTKDIKSLIAVLENQLHQFQPDIIGDEPKREHG